MGIIVNHMKVIVNQKLR